MVVQECLFCWRMGHLTWEQMLLTLACALVEQNTRLTGEAVRLVGAAGVPVVVREGGVTPDECSGDRHVYDFKKVRCRCGQQARVPTWEGWAVTDERLAELERLRAAVTVAWEAKRRADVGPPDRDAVVVADREGRDAALAWVAALREHGGALVAEVRRLRAALAEVGTLTRWVGWLEAGQCAHSGGRDMREIQRVVMETLGMSLSEYT